MKDLLFNPNLFFSKKLKKEINLKYPALVQLINCIPVIGLFYLGMKSLPSNVNSSVYAIVLLFFTIGILTASFLYWVILTGIFYFISSIFNSNGSFKRTLEFVGYGYVPLIFSGVEVFFAYLFFPLNDSLQNPQHLAEIFNNPIKVSSMVFGIICLFWSVYIWMFALLHARNMSKKNSILTVGIPAGIFEVISIYCLFRRFN